MLPNVFIHTDNTVSAPYCQLGRSIVYAWNARHLLWDDQLSCCNSIGCTCLVESPIQRKGTEEEKKKFYMALHASAA
jgi:hypothetical protein